MACQSDSGLRLRLCSPDGLLLYFHYIVIYHLDSLNMSYDNQKAQIKQGKLMQKVGLDPHEGRELGRADWTGNVSMASSFTAQDASKDGERGGGRNDEENECRGIRRRGRKLGWGGRGDLGLWQELPSTTLPPYLHAIIQTNSFGKLLFSLSYHFKILACMRRVFRTNY